MKLRSGQSHRLGRSRDWVDAWDWAESWTGQGQGLGGWRSWAESCTGQGRDWVDLRIGRSQGLEQVRREQGGFLALEPAGLASWLRSLRATVC